jgi:hypothetical protein
VWHRGVRLNDAVVCRWHDDNERQSGLLVQRRL